jgi:hypothetical protein
VVDSNAKLLKTVTAQALTIEALEARVKVLVCQVADYEARVVRLERILSDSLEVKVLRAKRHPARPAEVAE